MIGIIIVEDINRLIAKIRGKENPYLKVGEINQRNTKGISIIKGFKGY
ncbi:MAG: hypothetical protein IPM38_08235 [Ignavibacteria bacterium]|nr:hypothetical protein [Ignavibacteria bacterium]